MATSTRIFLGGVWAGVRYGVTGRKKSYYHETDFASEFSIRQKGEYAGLFALAAAEVVMTYIGYKSFVRDVINYPLISSYTKIMMAASLLYLGYQGIKSSYRLYRNLRSDIKLRRAFRRLTKESKESTP